MPERRQARIDRGADTSDVVGAAHRQALEIYEEQVLLRVVGQALLERDVEQVAAQAHRRIVEDARVHQRRRTPHDRHEVHVIENVALQVHPGRDLEQLEARVAQPEHAALGDVEHVLLPLDRLRTAEGAVLDRGDELPRLAFAHDVKAPALHRHLQRAGGEGADEDHLLGVLRDVDEAARPG